MSMLLLHKPKIGCKSCHLRLIFFVAVLNYAYVNEIYQCKQGRTLEPLLFRLGNYPIFWRAFSSALLLQRHEH